MQRTRSFMKIQIIYCVTKAETNRLCFNAGAIEFFLFKYYILHFSWCLSISKCWYIDVLRYLICHWPNELWELCNNFYFSYRFMNYIFEYLYWKFLYMKVWLISYSTSNFVSLLKWYVVSCLWNVLILMPKFIFRFSNKVISY